MTNIFQVLEELEGVRALVIGDVMLDVFEFCSSKESKELDSEKPGRRAYKSLKTIKVLGGAGNVAVNLASLGVQTSLVSLTGHDENYFKVRELAERDNVQHVLIRDASRPTTTKSRLYIDDEYSLRRDNEADHELSDETSSLLVNEVMHFIPKSDVVLLSDYDKGVFTEKNASQIIKECRLHGVPVVVDFKPCNSTYFVGADIISPNEIEASSIVKGYSHSLNVEENTKKLHTALECQNTVVTLGKNGICGYDGEQFFRIRGHSVNSVDAVGCGDTVRACLALGHAKGLSLKQCASLANDAAAIIVQKEATATLSLEELIQFIQSKAQD